MAFPWEAAIVAGASSAGSILITLAAAWKLYLHDIREGLLELRKAEREEHRDVWTEHRNLYELRIQATHEALGRDRDDVREKELTARHRRAQDEYLDLLDRAVKFPDIIDPSLSKNPDYVDFLNGRLDESIRSGELPQKRESTSEEQSYLRDLLIRVERHAPAPETADAYVTRGRAYFQATQYDNSLAAFEQALDLRPDDPEILTRRGSALGELRRHKEELADYERALQLDPDRADTLNNRGALFTDLGQFDLALTDYTRSLELRPGHAATFYNLACLFARWSKPAEASEKLGHAITRDAEYRSLAGNDPDFDNIRDDPRFLDLFPVISVTSATCRPLDSVSVEVRAKDSLAGIGAWTVDISYDASLLTASRCVARSGGMCNEAFSTDTVRFTGASAEGKRSEVLLGTIDFIAGAVPGIAVLAISVSVLADATVGAPRDTRAGLVTQDGAITIQ